jgi:preprotein translocase subunit SecG
MQSVLIVVQLIVSVALVIVVLMQKSEGGALGIGGGGGGGGLFSARGAGDALTRATAILAVLFFATSMGLVILALHSRPQKSILESAPAATKPITAPISKKPATKPATAPKKTPAPEVPGLPSPQQ